jgi:hypothetical protein
MKSVGNLVVMPHLRDDDQAAADGTLNLLYEAYILDGRGDVG